MFTEDAVVFTYTREDAIADGVQVNLSEKFPNDCQVYKFPVFCTARVWQLIESAVNNPEARNDFSGVVWDICWMSAKSPGRKVIADGTRTEFTVIVTGTDIEPDFYEGNQPIYRLQAICSPMDIDDPSPAITLMFPNED